jgi:hypothetical protein
VVQKGGGEVGKRNVEVVGSLDPANADASAPSPEPGEGAEEGRGGWARVTRRRAKAASAVGGSLQLAKTAKVFAATSELERKRKAEQSMADQIAALREMVLQLIKGQEAQREQAEAERVSQKQEVEELKAIIQSLRQETERQSRATTVLEGLSEKSVRTPTYSQVAQAGQQQATKTQKITIPSSQKGRLSTGPARADERAVNIDTGRTKAEKADFAVVKERLQEGLDKQKVTEGLKIDFLRPGPGDRIEVVFENKEQAEKARKHTQWATGQMPGTRVRGEEWYPIKCDMVAKQVVMDGEVGDGKTLKKDVCQAFMKDNTRDGHDFTAMKVHWLSKPDLAKKVGSLVIWLKSKLAAEHLLQSGTAIFGATGAYCSKWERREDNLPCFNCNKYGHKQASCTSAPKCALCSGKHSRLKCPRPTELCCPACNKEGHSVFDWKCQLHPNHWKHAGMQKAATALPTPQARSKTPKPTQAAEATPLQANNPPGGRFVLMANHRPASDETIRPTNEREVNMTDAAETLASNE